MNHSSKKKNYFILISCLFQNNKHPEAHALRSALNKTVLFLFEIFLQAAKCGRWSSPSGPAVTMETHKRRSSEKYTQHKNGRSLVCICAAAAGWISPVALPESCIGRKKLAARPALMNVPALLLLGPIWPPARTSKYSWREPDGCDRPHACARSRSLNGDFSPISERAR
jgi:hypothetical protein